MFASFRSVCLSVLLAAALLPCAYGAEVTRAHPPSEQEYWAQLDRRDWSAAVAAAEKLVETARQNSNAAPFELADKLSLLGNAQLAAKNFIAAEACYGEALQILEPRVVSTNDRLLEPLRGMGHTLAAGGKHEAAIPVLERALLVFRRTHGLFNFNQQTLLRQLAISQTNLGNYVEAEKQMIYLRRVGEQTYGARDPRMAAIFGLIGDFYMQAGFIGPARDNYRAALELVEKKLGRNSLATVEPLRAYANSYRRELTLSYFMMRAQSDRQAAAESAYGDRTANPRHLNADGEKLLLRALKTLDENPSRPPSLLFDTLLDIGDWYSVKSEFDAALPYYKRAAGIVEQIEPERIANAKTQLSFPIRLHYPTPLLATRNLGKPDAEVDERFVQVTFTVGADGSVSDETVVEKDGSARQITETLAATRAARYRPKFIDGEPVATADVSLRQVFRQRKESE